MSVSEVVLPVPMRPETSPPETSQRSDARRNRSRILDAARSVFADSASAGVTSEQSMAEVARRAGVGRATLYRNFATRRQLLEALFADEVDVMTAVLAVEDPADTFFDWLRRFATFQDNKRVIASELLEYADARDPVFSSSRERVIAAGEHVLAAAQESGDVRTDVTIEQALDLVLAIARLDRPRDQLNAILQLALDGLRPPR